MNRVIFSVVAAALTLIGPLVWAGPQLASDLMVGDRWTFADDLAVRESKCTRYYFLVSTCHVEYVNRRDPGRAGGTLSYLVVGSWAGERAVLLRSIEDPGVVGSTMGQEHMLQRLISFGLFLAAAIAFVLAMLRIAIGGTRPARPAPTQAGGIPPAPPGGALPAGPRTFGQRTARPSTAGQASV